MNKRLFSVALAGLLLLVSAAASSEAAEPGVPTLFREVKVATGDVVIALGKPFDPAGLAENVGERVYALLPGKFGGADRLLVTVSAAGSVSAMQFIYAQEASFDQVVGRYQARFGQPRAMDDAAREGGVYWDDGRTRFEVRPPSASVPAVSTVLLDR